LLKLTSLLRRFQKADQVGVCGHWTLDIGHWTVPGQYNSRV
jgi:hypothetical protein